MSFRMSSCEFLLKKMFKKRKCLSKNRNIKQQTREYVCGRLAKRLKRKGKTQNYIILFEISVIKEKNGRTCKGMIRKNQY